MTRLELKILVVVITLLCSSSAFASSWRSSRDPECSRWWETNKFECLQKLINGPWPKPIPVSGLRPVKFPASRPESRPAPRPAPKPAPKAAPRPAPAFDNVIPEIRDELKATLRGNKKLLAAWVQMGFHSCVGGCDGCLDLTNPANKGLIPTYQNVRRSYSLHKDDISLADYVVLHAVVAAEVAMGGRDGRIKFTTGRRTCPDPDHPQKGAQFPSGSDPDAFKVLKSEFGLSTQESIALLGAHSLGSCKFENSGFQGPWDFTPEKLDNGFYKSMRGIKWESLPISGKTQWTGRDGELMMLMSDLALLKSYRVSGTDRHPSCDRVDECPNSSTKTWVDLYAENENQFHKDFVRAYEKMLSR